MIKIYFLTILETGSPKSGCPNGWVSGENSPPASWLTYSHLLACPYMVEAERLEVAGLVC